MFFTISPYQDTRLPNHTKLGNLIVSHDNGWQSTDAGLFKGYQYTNTNCSNYALIKCCNDAITIEHDKFRSFPLWWDSSTSTLTNLLGTGESIWADKVLTMSCGKLEQTQTDVYGKIDVATVSLDSAIDFLISNFTQKFNLLAKQHYPHRKKLFVTGGVDTLMLLAFVKHCQIECNVIDYDHFEFDSFTNANIQPLKKHHWAYGQIHHWKEPTILLTGGCGDEFFFRGPYTIALWAAWHDIDIVSLLKRSSGYHVGYYLKDKNLKVFEDSFNIRDNIKDLYKTKEELIKQILNANINDHQHWHLGNTLTWTPFKDLELTKIILRLSEDEIIKHILDANINKQVIQRVYPKCLELLSTTKNSNPREHLGKLYSI